MSAGIHAAGDLSGKPREREGGLLSVRSFGISSPTRVTLGATRLVMRAIDHRTDSRCVARSLPNPEPQKCQSPPMRAGHEHPAEGRGNSDLTIRASPNSGLFRKPYYLPWGCSCPRLTGAALAQPRSTRAMPARRDAIVAAVAAYNRSHKPLPHSTVRLLEAMFTRDDVCRRSLETLEASPAFPAVTFRWSSRPPRQASVLGAVMRPLEPEMVLGEP